VAAALAGERRRKRRVAPGAWKFPWQLESAVALAFAWLLKMLLYLSSNAGTNCLSWKFAATAACPLSIPDTTEASTTHPAPLSRRRLSSH
jgi:hypothetical protein